MYLPGPNCGHNPQEPDHCAHNTGLNRTTEHPEPMPATPYSYARGVHNVRVRASDDNATLSDLRDAFGQPVRLEQRAIEYHNSTKTARSDLKKTLPYFVGGVINGKRHDTAVVERSLLTLDVEAPTERKNETEAQRRKRDAVGQPPPPQDVTDMLEALGMEGWVYTSISHTPAAPRYRVVLPLEKPLRGKALTEDVLKASTLGAAKVLGIEPWTTPESWVLSQPMYLPAKLKDGVFWESYAPGKPWESQAVVREDKVAADIPDERLDPVLVALRRAGLYLRAHPTHHGMHYITCPFVDQHEALNDTQTVYYEAHFDGNPRPAVKCFDTAPDEDGVPHLTYKTLVNWLRDGGHLTSKDENQDTATALEDYDTFMRQAHIGTFLRTEPEDREFAWEQFAPVGKVTVLAGPGGVSKSMLMLHLLVYGALGQSWAGFRVARPLRGLYASYEDDRMELHKRVHRLARGLREADNGAGELLYDIDGALQKNLLLYAADDNAISWLLMSKQDQRSAPERTARVEWLVGFIKHSGIKVIVLDPVVYTHNLEESSPGDMALYMQTLTYIAKQGGCAVVVLHHMHKTAQWATLEDINQGSLRGASSFADNSRSVGVLVSMPPKDALRYGIQPEQCTGFAVFKHVKHNYSAPLPPVVFERQGPLLLPRTDIKALSKEEADERQEQAKARTKAHTLESKAYILLGWLLEHKGATTNMVRDGTGIRYALFKDVMQYCKDQDWVQVRQGDMRALLNEVTALGREWFESRERERIADEKQARRKAK